MSVPLSQAVSGLLHLCGVPGGELHGEARTQGGVGYQAMRFLPQEDDYLPIALLQLLEGRSDWCVFLSPAARRPGTTHVLATRVLFVRWTGLARFGPSDWELPPEPRAAIDARLAAFRCAPTAMVDGGHECVAWWALDAPLDLSTEVAYEHARALQRRLATTLEASVAVQTTTRTRSAIDGDDRYIAETLEACDPASWLPLCGEVRGVGLRGERRLVDTLALEPARRYSIADMEAAINASSGKTSTPKRARAQEMAHAEAR